MIYAVFMLLVLAILAAQWRGSGLQMPLFLITSVAIVVFLISEMTTPLPLRF
jgi:hypothetical protein